jgi:hypothetical protein
LTDDYAVEFCQTGQIDQQDDLLLSEFPVRGRFLPGGGYLSETYLAAVTETQLESPIRWQHRLRDTNSKVRATCPLHGDFWPVVALHLRGPIHNI